MAESTFSIQAALQVSPPCYIRKVGRSGHWVPEESDPRKRAMAIQQQVFAPDADKRVSLYRVESGSDLARVAVALNANRSSLLEDILLVAIGQQELDGIRLEATRGDTRCVRANHLHRDMVIDDEAQAIHLVEVMLSTNRRPKRFTKRHMTEAVAEAAKDGCRATSTQSGTCVCESGSNTETRPVA